jgi:hypothetical protein
MKNLVAILLTCLGASALISCKKTQNASNPSIIGRWNLISDSTYLPLNGSTRTNKYVGVSTDYYDFEAGGKLSLKEGSISIDTASYSLISDNQIYISHSSNPTPCLCAFDFEVGTFKISALTDRMLTISQGTTTPDGPLGEVIIFSR